EIRGVDVVDPIVVKLVVGVAVLEIAACGNIERPGAVDRECGIALATGDGIGTPAGLSRGCGGIPDDDLRHAAVDVFGDRGISGTLTKGRGERRPEAGDRGAVRRHGNGSWRG